jgi:CheY-like chemotaxis protein
MDCQMPEMNGFEAATEIRRLEGPERRVAIVAMTADVSARCRASCVEAGMDDFIGKPVKLEDLIAVLTANAPAASSVKNPAQPVTRT